jgi:hypothetical protein
MPITQPIFGEIGYLHMQRDSQELDVLITATLGPIAAL